MTIRSHADLKRLREEGISLLRPERPRISVGMATCGLAAGAGAIFEALRNAGDVSGLDISLVSTGCIGCCQQEPVVDVYMPGLGRVLYARMTPEAGQKLITTLLVGEFPLEHALAVIPEAGSVPPKGMGLLSGLPLISELPFYAKQHKIILRNSGLIDPQSIEEYAAMGGYRSLSRALLELSSQDVIDEITRSGLRGRGGGGFPTGKKWQVCSHAAGTPRYIICNADEGDPGAYMDRTVLESDPYAVIEGMTIGGYAIGASQGYVYVRNEYPLAIERIRHAIEKSETLGLLGEDILGSGFSFSIDVVRGAGAFVCGEETALIASMEGGLGEPRPKPPYPAVKGLWGQPTIINNVKTLASVSAIVAQGADWYAGIGTEGNTGTVVFSLVGKIANTGLVEAPLGLTLAEMIYGIGGGGLDGRRVKAVQTGGPSGGCIPASLFHLPIDYSSLRQAGSIMGSGGMVVMDEKTCMVDVARYFLKFTMAESCGKCTPCREGTRYMYEILTRIVEGEGTPGDIDLLEEVARWVNKASLCGLGQTAPNPVLTALRYFRDEFDSHIAEKSCQAGACRALVRADCVNACPGKVDVPNWLALVAQGRYAEGMEIHRRKNPFVLVCGRVCPAFCERKCRRGDLDEPIAIRQAKRYMADSDMTNQWTPPKLEEPKTQNVAVVGSGPAGLTAALRLAQKGYPVTIFERLPVMGGMMAVGIPAYRLPREILKFEIDGILRAGINIRMEQAMGRDFTIDSLFNDGYKAVILAIGAHKSRVLGIEGEESNGVYQGVEFLRNVALGNPPKVARMSLGVVGGGNVAIDAARSALRLDAKEVHIIYRRRREDMPAYTKEVDAAETEGIIFHFLSSPVRIISDGRVKGVKCQKMALGGFDRTGRELVTPIAGSEFTLSFDVLIPAIGQETDLDAKDGLEINRDTTLVVNNALATTREGVFAAGDVVSGPATVIHAVAQGNSVAGNVDHYLRTGRVKKVITVPGYQVTEQKFSLKDYAEAKRLPLFELPIAERQNNFDEVELKPEEDAIKNECRRCLRCDLEWLEKMRLPLEAREDEILSDTND